MICMVCYIGLVSVVEMPNWHLSELIFPLKNNVFVETWRYFARVRNTVIRMKKYV